MEQVKYGSLVKLHYTGRLASGVEFDSTQDVGPVEFKVGGGVVLESFEKAILGMGANEKRTFKIAPDEAYGPRDESLDHTFKRSELEADFEPCVGNVVAVEMDDGQQIPGMIKSFDDNIVEVDLNHPLAGHDLHYDVEIIAISQTGKSPVGDEE